jgi:arabinan endo-1,5-alpha-L-arabinosidase
LRGLWDGIKLVKLKPDRTGIAQQQQWYRVALWNRQFGLPDRVAGNAAIEGFLYFS